MKGPVLCGTLLAAIGNLQAAAAEACNGFGAMLASFPQGVKGLYVHQMQCHVRGCPGNIHDARVINEHLLQYVDGNVEWALNDHVLKGVTFAHLFCSQAEQGWQQILCTAYINAFVG